MSVRKSIFSSFGRGAALATVAAVALAAVQPSVAMAGSTTPAALSANHGTSGNTDFSAARRHYRGGGGAAALAAFAGIVGTIGAVAAAQERRDYYDSGYYGGGPAYYDGGPAYYGGGPAYYDAPGYGYYGGLAAPRNGPRYGRSDRGGF
ncbi:MAG: hypothetical protein JWQ17_3923 [Tardiphaga sp.]|nr:hypothetical protein [Tardiphaga sp.]